MTQVLLTVDAALRWASHARGDGWQRSLEALDLPGKLDLLGRNGLKACFFVDPMPALVYGIDPIRLMVEPILAAGQEVQLHLHPVWQSVAEGVAEGARFELTCFDAEDQLDLIETARDLLVEAGAPAPLAFRSGGYAADVRTLAALLQAGLRFDSSHLPGKSALPLEPDLTGPVDLGGIVEVPVAGHFGGACDEAMEAALLAGGPLVALATDGPETDGQAFERICAFLVERSDRFATAHFTDLEPASASAAGGRLRPRAWRRARQMAERSWPQALRTGTR